MLLVVAQQSKILCPKCISVFDWIWLENGFALDMNSKLIYITPKYYIFNHQNQEIKYSACIWLSAFIECAGASETN